MAEARPACAPAARLLDVSKVWGTTAVLRHASLQFAPGECVLLLGPNGAGKSTLLRLLAGLLRPSFGRVEVLGGTPEQARGRVGFMAHAAMLYEEFSALENLRYFAALAGGKAPGGMKAEEALALVGLDPLVSRPVRQYSQGMRQRCSLARVLMGAPDLLLLDEPFSNLDRSGAREMVAVLGRVRDKGAAVVLTTHQRELVEGLADRVLGLAEGRLTDGAPSL